MQPRRGLQIHRIRLVRQREGEEAVAAAVGRPSLNTPLVLIAATANPLVGVTAPWSGRLR